MSESELDKQILTGRKVFFIQPNLHSIPESFCEDFLENGYECYFLKSTRSENLQKKLEILIEEFKDVILLFYVDSPEPVPGISWISFIHDLNMKYNKKILTAVLFDKRPTLQESELVIKQYLKESLINCGAHEIGYDKTKNYKIIREILLMYHAQGRRKNVRAVCYSNSKVRFRYNKDEYFINITDISLSHFTCTFPKGTLNARLYEKIDDMEFNIRGIHFRHNAIVFIKRETDNDNEICVFMFSNRRAQQGLDDTVKSILLPKMYELMTDNFNRLFEKIENERKQEKENPRIGRTVETNNQDSSQQQNASQTNEAAQVTNKDELDKALSIDDL